MAWTFRPTLSNWNDTVTPDVTTKYDAASRVTQIINSNATTVRNYYNDNLLSTETSTYGDNIARAVTYTYDGDGRRASLKYPNNAYTFDYGYTARSQLDTVTNDATNTVIANYGYDLDGNLTTRTLNNSTSSTFGYDPMNRVTSISHALTGTTRTFGYGYDSVGNRNFVKRDAGNGDAYDYDLSDQTTAVKLNIASPDAVGAAGPQTINYDANGNRTSFAAYGTTETYGINALNQYTSRNSSTATYDANGNLITGLDGSTYTYDAQNRILSATKAGTTDVMTYDGLNRQVSKKFGAGAVFYRVYDGWDLLGEYQTGSTSAYGAYLYGAGGIVKNLVTNKYYYQDGSGSTSHLAGGTGALLESYRYDLQGKPIFYNASNTPIPATANGVRHLFTGQQWYSELGLYDLRNRYYSPDIGRFVQADPIGFDGDPTNLYRYCGNDPINDTDPNGLNTFLGAKIILTSFPKPFWSGNTWDAHQSVYTTNPDGSLAHTYSWGSNGNPGIWQQDGQAPQVWAASKALISMRPHPGGYPIGDASLDPYVQQAFNQLSQEPSHYNWGLVGSCQQEAQRLIDLAKQLRARATSDAAAGMSVVVTATATPDMQEALRRIENAFPGSLLGGFATSITPYAPSGPNVFLSGYTTTTGGTTIPGGGGVPAGQWVPCVVTNAQL